MNRKSLLNRDEPLDVITCGRAVSVIVGLAKELSVEKEAKGLKVNLDGAEWRKSNRSGRHSDNCVEVAFVDGAIAVRDSKHPDGPVLLFTQAEWDAFVGGARDGEFDV
jgi:hypothetical protein